MYEKHYGLSAPPFQIHPDPSFYFESKGHGNAYQYLRFGAFQGEGFIVVTGDIGAGKTTLLRALLSELDPGKVVAAQVVSTQLGADDLLYAVALGFGINGQGLSKARLLVTLEAFLASLATANRRALLIIDEAQNLDPKAIEELRMLSNFQFGNRALLQSFLVGQPELRDILRLPQLEQLRQRVLASCHLGPMEPAETRGYIEHRLRHVGWKQRPGFDDEAFELIHAASAGVPRRINTLCNRLLLSAFLDEAERIDAARVLRVEAELSAEIGGDARRHRLLAAANASRSTREVLLCVAASQPALLCAAALSQAFAQREDLPPPLLLRFQGPGAIGDGELAQRDLRELGVSDPGSEVVLHAATSAGRAAEAAAALAARLDAREVGAVVLVGDAPVDVACAMAAAAAEVPVVRVEAGQRGQAAAPLRRRRELLDHAADLLFCAEWGDQEWLHAEAVDSQATHLVGSVAVDAVRLAPARGAAAEQLLRREGVPLSVLSDPAGFALVVLRDGDERATGEAVVALNAQMRKLGWMFSLVCVVRSGQRDALAQRCAHALATAVHAIDTPSHVEMLGLMRHARCLLSDSEWLRAQALALGVPSLVLDPHSVETEKSSSEIRRIAGELADIIASGGRRVQPPDLFDGHASERVAARLADWLLARQDGAYRDYLERA